MALDTLTEFDEVLAGHLVVDAERIPAHRPVGLPLQLAMAAGDGRREALAALGIAPVDRAGVDVAPRERDLHHDAGLGVDGQEGRIGRRALLAEGRQHDLHHRVIAREQAQQRLVEAARAIVMRRGSEFIVEAEGVEEGAQPRIVMRPEALMRAERIGHLGERLAEMLADQILIGDVVGNLAQPVHVVGKGEELRRDRAFGQNLEGVAHH